MWCVAKDMHDSFRLCWQLTVNNCVITCVHASATAAMPSLALHIACILSNCNSLHVCLCIYTIYLLAFMALYKVNVKGKSEVRILEY